MEQITIDNVEYLRTYPLNGYNWSLSHFGHLDYNPTVYCLLAALFAVALWLVIDIAFQVHLTFRKYGGLYYYAILATNFGIACHAVSFITKLFLVLDTQEKIGTTVIAKLGWVLNTTGFSVVLYSRLNLVIQSEKVLKFVLAIILINGVLFHTPVIVFSFGMSTPDYEFWLHSMQIAERIQVMGFTIQEFALTTVYTWTAANLLRHRSTSVHRKLFAALLFAQAFALVADLTMVVLDFVDMFTLKASLHPFIYAVKLKIEFIVLNQLLCLVQPNSDFFVYLGDPTLLHTTSRRKRGSNSPTIMQSPEVDVEKAIGIEDCRSISYDSSESSSGTPSTPMSAHFFSVELHCQPQYNAPSMTASSEASNQRGSENQDPIDTLEKRYLGQFR